MIALNTCKECIFKNCFLKVILFEMSKKGRVITKKEFVESSKDSTWLQIDGFNSAPSFFSQIPHFFFPLVGSVYDVTLFVEHPGGPEALDNNNRKDATPRFDKVMDHLSQEAVEYLENYYIGQMEGFESQELAHSKRKKLLKVEEKKPTRVFVKPAPQSSSDLNSTMKIFIAVILLIASFYFFMR